MGEQITLDAEFLRRALNVGPETSSADVEVTPGALPPGCPLSLPGLPGLRVLGGVRSAALQQTPSPSRWTWRVFLDVAGSPPDVMGTFIASLEEQGWQAGPMWRRAFVEAASSEWTGVHAGQERMMTLHTRGEAGVTPVSLAVHDVEPEQVRHLLGVHPHAHFHHGQLPLPTLTAPQGWRVQVQGGGGGETERSERAVLLPPDGAEVEVAALLALFRPQLEGQGWTVLHVGQEARALYLTARTGPGVGVLTLRPDGEVWQAALLHLALGPGGSYASSSYTLSSGG